MRIKLTIQYKGTNYHGWQVQPAHITIQQVLQDNLSKIFNQPIHVIGCSRTDAGVHAMMHVSHFDVQVLNDRQNRMLIPANLQNSLNKLLPRDIVITQVKKVADTFHAIRDAKKKTYIYQILNTPLREPLNDDYVWHVPYPLNVTAMKKAFKYFLGEHDFKAFAATNGKAKTSVREVYKISCQKVERSKGQNHKGAASLKVKEVSVQQVSKSTSQQVILISITGSGFLKNMVRNIVGTVVEVGLGKRKPEQIKEILESRDRKKAGCIAPPEGLFLKEVVY